MKNTPRHKARRLRRMADVVESMAFDTQFCGVTYPAKKNDVNTLLEVAKILRAEHDKIVRKNFR